MPKLEVPKAFMQGLIAFLLLANFTFMLIAPTIWNQYKDPSAAMQQTLVNLVILAVGYYLGSSQGSARKDELSAQQTDKAISALAPTPLGPAPEPTPVTITNPAPVDVAVVKTK